MSKNNLKIFSYLSLNLKEGDSYIVIVILLSALMLFSSQGQSSPVDNEYTDMVSRADRLFWVGELDSVGEFGEILIAKFPEKSEGYRILCMYWISENDWDKAIKSGKKAVKAEENSGMAHHWLGRAFGLKAKNSSRFRAAFLVGDVKKHFIRAAELMPDYIRTHEDLFNFYSGSPKIAGGSREKAEEELEHIKSLDSFRGSEMKANYYLSLGENNLAEKEIELAIAHDSTDLNVRWTKTNILMSINRLSARKQLRLIKIMSPDDSLKVFYKLGLTYLFEGDSLSTGVNIYSRYISSPRAKSDPSYPASFWRRGMLYEKAGDLLRAKTDYEKCLSMNPSFNPAKRSLAKIDKRIGKMNK